MPVRPGNPLSDRNMAGVIYKSDRPEDGTAVSPDETTRQEGPGIRRDAETEEIGGDHSGATAEPVGGLDGDGGDNADGKPNQSDNKGEWESYAQAQGVDTEGMTKDQIIDAVG